MTKGADPKALAGKRILVVGSGVAAISRQITPSMVRTKELGVEIVLLDSADTPLRHYVDSVIAADPRDFDAARKAVERAHYDGPLNGIVGFRDETSVIAARLQDCFGFPGHSPPGSQAAFDKNEMRKIMKSTGLATPEFAFVQSREAMAALAEWFPLPAFLKLSDGAASIASRRIRTRDRFLPAFDEAVRVMTDAVPEEVRQAGFAPFRSDRPNFLIEDYLAPAERLAVSGLGRITIELLVQDSEIRFFAIADGRCFSADDHRYMSLSFPTLLTDPDCQAFRALAEDVVRVFGLSNGSLTLDAVMTEDGPQLYEINARIEAARFLPTVQTYWGVDLLEETLKIAAGIPVMPILRPKGTVGAVTFHKVLAPQASRITRLEIAGPDAARTGCKVNVLKKVGDYVGGPEAINDCIAIIEAVGSDRSEAEERLQSLLNSMQLDLEPSSPHSGAP